MDWNGEICNVSKMYNMLNAARRIRRIGIPGARLGKVAILNKVARKDLFENRTVE